MRGEAILCQWSVPWIAAVDPLGARALSLEARYRPVPALHVAARFDSLSFSRVQGTLFEGRPTAWEAPVERLELGAGYRILRNLTLKAAYQRDWRDSPVQRSLHLVAAQLAFWL